MRISGINAYSNASLTQRKNVSFGLFADSKKEALELIAQGKDVKYDETRGLEAEKIATDILKDESPKEYKDGLWGLKTVMGIVTYKNNDGSLSSLRNDEYISTSKHQISYDNLIDDSYLADVVDLAYASAVIAEDEQDLDTTKEDLKRLNAAIGEDMNKKKGILHWFDRLGN